MILSELEIENMNHPQNGTYYGFDPADVLMVGLGATAVCYYRVLLPAHELGCDYVGLNGEPPRTTYATGLIGGESKQPDFTAYKVVILQQPRGKEWLEVIRALQDRGTVVIYEVDDWLHAVKNLPDHGARRRFNNAALAEYEACMKACDAMIVSTPFLARCYQHFNKRVYVCENGIDLARYDVTRPPRPTVNIGWAGATGHATAVKPWLEVTGELMLEFPDTVFVSIGQRWADALAAHFGAHRAISIPFAAIEQYPAAMTMLDIALAPAGKTGFHRAKSDLRWLEAGALGIPVVASPRPYGYIEHGVTGFHAANAREAKRILRELILNEELRTEVGENARAYVRDCRSMRVMADQWRDTICTVLNGR